MNNGSNARAMVETALLTAISVILIAASFYLPAFYLIGYFLWPVPLALICIRHSLGHGIASIFITALIIIVISDPISALSVVFSYGGVGLALGYSVKNREPIKFTILIIFAASFISTLVTIKVFNLIAGYDVISNSLDMVAQGMNSLREIYEGYGVSKEQLDQVFKAFDVQLIKSILPSFMAIYSIIAAFFTYWLFQRIARKLRISIEELKPFSMLYIPNQFSMVFIVFGLIGYFLISYTGFSQETYVLNIYMIFTFLFSVGGLAVVTFFLKKKGFPKFAIFILGAFLIMSPLSQILIYIGLADYIFNFRKIDIKRRYNKK